MTNASVFHSLHELRALVGRGVRPLCLYSGGLDGTYLLWQLHSIGCQKAVALSVDIGGDALDERVRAVCESLNAELVIEPRRDEFAIDFVRPAIFGQGRYLGGHPISASLSRPLMARTAIKVANEYRCNAIIHTSTRSQNSLRRFNGALKSLEYDGFFGSPFELTHVARKEKLETLRASGLLGELLSEGSRDTNLWCREFESGEVDDPEAIRIPEELYRWTATKMVEAGVVAVRFVRGVPTRVDGVDLGLAELILTLNARVGAYQIGRYLGLEEGPDGAKVVEVRETPAAHLLLAGYRAIESGCLAAEAIREKLYVEQIWVREAMEGRWFQGLRDAAQRFNEALAARVSGTVTFELGLRQMTLRGIECDFPLYIRDREKYEAVGREPPAI